MGMKFLHFNKAAPFNKEAKAMEVETAHKAMHLTQDRDAGIQPQRRKELVV